MDKSRVFKYLINIIFPNCCPVCGRLIEWDGLICEECLKALPYNSEGLCPICGKSRCIEHSQICFDGIFTLVRYEEPVIGAIYDLKNGVSLNFAQYAAAKTAENIRAVGLDKEIDLITAVPMHWQKKSDRGLNHAEKTAKIMAEELHKPLDTSLLKKKRDRRSHHKLTAAERRSHADRVFYISKKHNDIIGRTVLLCDDVYTTGATLNRCASLLKEIGAEKVYCMAVANTELEEVK